MMARFGFLFWLTAAGLVANDLPVTIVKGPVSGHIHPSICQTPDGALVMVCKGGGGLLRSRSIDGGKTWDKPALIATTAKRPKVIREVKIFEVYPGTADTLPDGRVLVTWNYIANDKARDGYYERALLYTLSRDRGSTWSKQALIVPVDGKHLGAVRHNVLPWAGDRWLLPLRTGAPRVFNTKTGALKVFPLKIAGGKQHEFQQIIRTDKDTLMAMGPELLRSTDNGRHWSAVKNFPAAATARDNLEGRHLTALPGGRVLVTWGVGHQNKGLRYNFSADDGKTWSRKSTVLLPETPVTARYYSARTLPLDTQHVGTVFMNRHGVHFLKVKLDRLTK
jgi:Neuraminidase (sialidase)